MASLQDVADQINAKLDQIINNTASTVSGVSAVNSTLGVGFANLGAGLFALLEVQRSALQELTHHSAQNGTIICLLENSNELLCGMTRKMTEQLAVAAATRTAVERIEGMLERVYCDAAGDYDRLDEMKAAMEKCCPPPEVEVEPCPEACEVPRHRPRKPDGQDWRPLPAPQPEG